MGTIFGSLQRKRHRHHHYHYDHGAGVESPARSQFQGLDPTLAHPHELGAQLHLRGIYWNKPQYGCHPLCGSWMPRRSKG